MSDNTEKAIDAAADVAETVSESAERLAEFTRQLNKTKIQFALLGMAAGATTAALITFKLVYLKAETKYSKISDNEIAEMREHYQAKIRALEGAKKKPDLQSIVEEKGYSQSEGPPMAVQPPETVITEEPEEEDEEDSEESLGYFKGHDGKKIPKISQEELKKGLIEPKVEDTWDYQEELKRRSPDIPYVIHIDESDEMEGYQKVTLIYYEVDDVLCNEKDEVVDPDFERDRLVGEKNLDLFGHGSGQADVVYIRNDTLEIVFEVCKSPNSFAEEVHGFQHEDWYRGNLERMRVRERDDPEE